jgi:hypothetical protein
MWDPQQLTTLLAYSACYGDNFMFLTDKEAMRIYLNRSALVELSSGYTD